MIEIIYRIYEVADEETAIQNLAKDDNFGLFSSISKSRNIELHMDCMLCDSRDQFKQSIRATWGEKIAFRYSSKMTPGDLYCIIIGEHCYNAEKYFNRIKFKCDCCGSTVETYYGRPIAFSEYEVRSKLFNISEYLDKRFCCHQCKDNYEERTLRELRPEEDREFYITKDMFTTDISGYIYLITKKSTGEFYVGQTAHVPVFRWGQHLKTDRFPLTDIEDYVFEVLEIVSKSENILEREKYYIQLMYKSCPDKSLNISGTKNIKLDDEPQSL